MGSGEKIFCRLVGLVTRATRGEFTVQPSKVIYGLG